MDDLSSNNEISPATESKHKKYAKNRKPYQARSRRRLQKQIYKNIVAKQSQESSRSQESQQTNATDESIDIPLSNISGVFLSSVPPKILPESQLSTAQDTIINSGIEIPPSNITDVLSSSVPPEIPPESPLSTTQDTFINSDVEMEYSMDNIGIEPDIDSVLRIHQIKIVRGTTCQNDPKFGSSAGRQCTAMAAFAIVFSTLKPIDTWITNTIDKILDIGDELYKKSFSFRDQSRPDGMHGINRQMDENYLSASELLNNVNITESYYCSFQIASSYDGHFSNNIDDSSFFLPLHKRLDQVFKNKNAAAILTMNLVSVAIISYNDLYYIFDSHSRNSEGKHIDDDGKSCLCCFQSLEDVHDMISYNMYNCEVNLDKESFLSLHRNMYNLSVLEVEESLKKRKRNTDNSTSACSRNISDVPDSDPLPSDPLPSNPLPSDNPSADSTSFDFSDASNIRKPPRHYTRKPSMHKSKSIVDFNYVDKEKNKLFIVHRESSYNEACRGWQCESRYIGSVLNGLQCVLHFECSACEYNFSVLSEPDEPDELPTNQGIVLGCFGSGIGFYQLEGLLASVNIPCHDYKSYQEMEILMGLHVERAAIQSMANAGVEAEAKARQDGRITAIGNMAHTTVVVDGSWGKRSYKTGSFNSPSGLGVVIDYYTKKVLDVGVANQRCLQCQCGKDLAHVCWCNYDSKKTSSSMESSNLLRLFLCSVEKHKLVYQRLIGDGDSSAIKLITDHNPYADFDITVEKILCINHLLRRLSTNLANLAIMEIFKEYVALKNFLKTAGGKASTAIRAAAKYWQSVDDSYDSKIANMLADLENMPYHIFGQHDDCKEHYCDGNETGATNYVDELLKINMWNTVLGCFGTCISAPLDFLLNATNNLAESFNNVVASKNFAKRIDSYKRGGYTFRVCYSVIQFNSKTAMCDVYESMGKNVPDRLRLLENRRKKKVEDNARRATDKGFRNRHPETNYSRNDSHYGPGANPPTMSPEAFQARLEVHEQKLSSLQADRVNIEQKTVGQSRSVQWHSTRRLFLTASNFKIACQCRKLSTQNKAVRDILYSPVSNFHPAINHGIINESKALDNLSKEYNIEIKKCGFFIDANILGLGATPDGLIGDDGVVEIKCPYTIKNMSVGEAIKNHVPWCKPHFEKNKPEALLKSSPYYYQIQGQLHITGRKYCLLSIWTFQNSLNLVIHYDEKFFTEKMLPRLTKFYWSHLVPEMLNPKLLYSSSNDDAEDYSHEVTDPATTWKEVDDALNEFLLCDHLSQPCSLVPTMRLRKEGFEENKDEPKTNKKQPPPDTDALLYSNEDNEDEDNDSGHLMDDYDIFEEFSQLEYQNMLKDYGL